MGENGEIGGKEEKYIKESRCEEIFESPRTTAGRRG